MRVWCYFNVNFRLRYIFDIWMIFFSFFCYRSVNYSTITYHLAIAIGKKRYAYSLMWTKIIWQCGIWLLLMGVMSLQSVVCEYLLNEIHGFWSTLFPFYSTIHPSTPRQRKIVKRFFLSYKHLHKAEDFFSIIVYALVCDVLC